MGWEAGVWSAELFYFFGLDGGVLGIYFLTRHLDVPLKILLFSVCVIFRVSKCFKNERNEKNNLGFGLNILSYT